MPDAVDRALGRELAAAAAELTADEREWLASCFEDLTVEMEVVTPSEWAERSRYLPPQLTPMPGFYRFEVAPYLREIVDCLAVDSPIREVAVMKGAQVGVTVGVLENGIGYCIDHVTTAPVMMVTADAEMAKNRMEQNIAPMIQDSGLADRIKSADESNKRRSGKTARRLEWEGGGFLVPFGAVNANKLRSISIQYLLRDEIDGWPLTVGRDGDPLKLSQARTAAYEGGRKILDLSTPLLKGTSKIAERFARGDQRYYFVCCLECGHPQVLRFRRTDPDTGEVSGIVWETDGGRLVPDSVRYLCEKCGHPHTNDDKTRLLSPENGAEWRPTAEPASPDVRSYHLSALYSPVGMQTWAGCVSQWLEAWDEEKSRARDMEQLQTFYNNVLGEPFEVRGEKIRFEQVSPHRRREYRLGQVPNELATRVAGSPILLLTCAVDVHKEELPVGVVGWARGRRPFLLDYWRMEGDTEQLDNPATWDRLRQLIEAGDPADPGSWAYVADDGKRYRVQLTLIDSGYRADHVYQFCAEYEAGVFPVKGRQEPPKATNREFSAFQTPMGTTAYSVTVDMYKDRLSAALRRSWDGQSMQPPGHFNAPLDISDDALKELTRETKQAKIDARTGKRLGFEWRRPSGAANELWDILVYNSAALDIIAWDVCRNQLGLEFVSWPAFWELAENEKLYFVQE